MKNAYWGYWLIMLGIFVVVIMMLASDATTTNTQDYYQLKEVANSALYDSLDYSYYSQTRQVRILKEIFVENFIRRFSETISPTDSYTVQFYDLYESPPKVSVKIATSTAGFIVGRDTGEDAITSLDVVNSIDLIIELKANDPKNCQNDVDCDRSLIDKSQCPYYGNGSTSGTPTPSTPSTPSNTNPTTPSTPAPTTPSNPTTPTTPSTSTPSPNGFTNWYDGNSNPIKGQYFSPVQGDSNLVFEHFCNASGVNEVTPGCTNNTSPVEHDAYLPVGTPIYAAISGTATFEQWTCGNELYSYGNYVSITSGNTQVRYAHLNGFASAVTNGYSGSLVTKTCDYATTGVSCTASRCTQGLQKKTIKTIQVREGDLIGYSGMSGNAKEPHLHIEVKEGGVCKSLNQKFGLNNQFKCHT